jgi:phosphonate transport system substrate-binding protein
MPASAIHSPVQPSFRFGLPPSLGGAAEDRGPRVARFLAPVLGRPVEVSVAKSYEGLWKDILAGRLDAGWAPPFLCARLEAMGARVLARGVRGGASTYRAALLCRAGAKLTLDRLQGATVTWVDRDSVSGYLLPVALLRSRGLDPGKVFSTQAFAGSFLGAVQAVLDERADLTSVFAPPQGSSVPWQQGVEDLAPGRSHEVSCLAFTDESPNDGVVTAVGTDPGLVAALEQSLLTLHDLRDGQGLLKEVFHAERFEPAPRLGYRALYRVALATL